MSDGYVQPKLWGQAREDYEERGGVGASRHGNDDAFALADDAMLADVREYSPLNC